MNRCIGILGCGQLGMMLAQSARNLGAKVCFLAVDETPVVHGLGDIYDESQLDEFIDRIDCATIEREAIPERILEKVAANTRLSPSFDALIRLRSRHSQKALFDELALNTSPWCLVECAADLPAALAGFANRRVRAKRVLGGYDGGGQWTMQADQEPPTVADSDYPLILEAEIDIDEEVSVLMARGADGQFECYPINYNEMRNGVLAWSLIPAPISHELQIKAKTYVEKIMNHLNYVGVLAMEFFISQGELIVNEIAPRVHNTGHWTIEGAQCSQFEQHVRAVMGLPLLPHGALGAAGLCNLLGDARPKDFPSEPVRMYLHWYGKSFRPGRKMGHLTLIGPDLDAVRRATDELALF